MDIQLYSLSCLIQGTSIILKPYLKHIEHPVLVQCHSLPGF